MPGRILHDELRRAIIGDVVVPPLADRDALEKIFAMIERLAQLQDVAFALQRDAELLAHQARAAVASDEVLRHDLGRLAVGGLDIGGDGVTVLAK